MSRILVVEDEKDIADLITHYLQRAGHAVETVGSGSAAVTRVKDAPPDLIVLDLEAGDDGEVLSAPFAEQSRTAQTPLVLLGSLRRGLGSFRRRCHCCIDRQKADNLFSE